MGKTVDHERVDYARRESGSWTSNVEVPAYIGGSGSDEADYLALGVVRGESDKHHFIFSGDKSGGGAFSDIFHRSLNSSNTLGTQHTAITDWNVEGRTANPVYYDDAGVERITIAGDRSSNILGAVEVDDDGTPSSEEDVDSTNVMGQFSCLAVDQKNVIALWVRSDNDLYTAENDDSAGWGSVTERIDAATIEWASCNVYVRGSNWVLGYFYYDSGLAEYRYNEVSLRSAATTYYFTLNGTGVGVAVLSRTPTFVETLAATAVGVATLTTVKTLYRTLAATAIGVTALLRKQFVTLDAVAVGVAGLTKALLFTITLAATAVGAAVLDFIQVLGLTLNATAVGVANLTRVATFVNTLAATAIAVPSLARKQFVTIAATAVGVTEIVRKQFVTLAATALGTANLSFVLSAARTLTSTALGVAVLVKVFIGSGGPPGFRRIVRFFRRVGKRIAIFGRSQ